MTPEEQKEFNIKCAVLLWPDAVNYIPYEHGTIEVHIPRNGQPHEVIRFNPYSDANDRNKVIEKMRIDTSWYWNDKVMWLCRGAAPEYFAENKSMEAAQIACISKVLEDRDERRTDSNS